MCSFPLLLSQKCNTHKIYKNFCVLCRLIMLTSYTIGKEKLFVEIARRCRVSICVSSAKLEVMRLLPWPEDVPLDKLFTTDPRSTPVHVMAWNWLGDTWYVCGYVLDVCLY